ncbi:hypothetical protein PR202_gb01988 [Eleusine coracana subsp. coracana]|uniref:Uncharacterized protein n=1 Tax=Eleusine coracana subsp. coracana TaxID=191504 RepID=A0AAV5DXR7_ELECO|nr:hypothetical protein PR202_gb01988 [Eleusine coracana subsp. coracana]
MLPLGAIDQLDKYRRSFVWSGTDHASGVAWDKVTQPREQGGLGIRNIVVQNQCLLMKLLYRLYHPAGSAWALWTRTKINLATLEGPLKGPHWTALRALLPAYQSITMSEVGDGTAIDFWDDTWLPGGALSDMFSALHSHADARHFSVRHAMTVGVGNTLVPRLSTLARVEISILEDLLSIIQLISEPDRRLSPFSASSNKLKTSSLYRALSTNGT